MSTHAAPIKSRHDPRRPSPSPAVEVSRLRKEFKRSDRRSRVGKKRRVVALHELTFSIERGECVAVLGQNGSGKSTLVRLLSTLLLGDGGTPRISGHNVFTEPRSVRRLVNSMGVGRAIDDFGTGYSSLTYLKRFDVDLLKVDGSFVEGIGLDAGDSAITATVIDLAHSMKLSAVAEGVEVRHQADHLRELGCDLAQGYHFGVPQPPEAIDKLLIAADRQ